MEHPNVERLDAVFRADEFAVGLGLELLEWGGGWARVAWTPSEQHRNFGGAVHGAGVFGLGDYTFAVSCNSWGRQAVALSVDVHFLSAAAPGRRLVAVGRERSLTRRTGSYAIEISDDQDRPVSSLHALAYRRSGWHLGEDAWPESWRAAH